MTNRHNGSFYILISFGFVFRLQIWDQAQNAKFQDAQRQREHWAAVAEFRNAQRQGMPFTNLAQFQQYQNAQRQRMRSRSPTGRPASPGPSDSNSGQEPAPSM